MCSWVRHLTLKVSLSTQVLKWIPTNLIPGSDPAMDYHPIWGGVEILLVTSCYRNQDKVWSDGPPGSYADSSYLLSGQPTDQRVDGLTERQTYHRKEIRWV